MICYTYRTLEDYAKWHLILNIIQYTGEDNLPGLHKNRFPSSLHKNRFPKISKFGDDRSQDCVEFVEMAMPFALARPFVDKYISDSLIVKVNICVCSFLYLHNHIHIITRVDC